MARITYVPKKFNASHTQAINQANAICSEYASQGLSLTLRQVYYQFVARGFLPNEQSEYKRLGSILNDARMGGAMDWDFLIDRTRNLVDLPHWDNPADLVKQAGKQYRTDLWKTQKKRVEVWIEKDAGIGVIEDVCRANDVAYFSCRGYTSVSELWSAAQRIRNYIEDGEQVTILHVGDHDPSGIDMSRDIGDRLRTFLTRDWAILRDPFLRGSVTRGAVRQSMRDHMHTQGSQIGDHEDPWLVKRIALTYEQVLEYDPPPNPAKTTDVRFQKYVEETGLDESWELDALDPIVLQDLIQHHINRVRDEEVWAEANLVMETDRQILETAADKWADITAALAPKEGPR